MLGADSLTYELSGFVRHSLSACCVFRFILVRTIQNLHFELNLEAYYLFLFSMAVMIMKVKNSLTFVIKL